MGFLAGQAPTFTLYGDGTVIYRDWSQQQPNPIGDAQPQIPFHTVKLTEAEIQQLLEYVIGPGALGIARAKYDGAMCADCHQNLAPLFSRQVWEETNANPRVAAALARPGGNGGRGRTDYHGVPIHRGVDVPNAIDAATDPARDTCAAPAFITATLTASTRLIWPAPIASVWRASVKMTVFDLTCAQIRQANRSASHSSAVG